VAAAEVTAAAASSFKKLVMDFVITNRKFTFC
jgi:hypothetical protein